ncbi:MAG: hypothetical protein LBS71_00940 [Puniceicoccales bacterium]|jgi:general secretion pathway protein D|nr:hypothetical protein [Puniceicoccales bacterium]
MKKGKYLMLGLFPLAVSADMLDNSVQRSNNPSSRTGVDSRSTAGGAPVERNSQDIVDQLVLAGADPKEVIGILEKLTGRTALLEQKLPTTKISIEIQEPISRQEAISAIESVLSLNGIVIVDMGEKFMKAVTSKSAITQSPDIVDESLLAYEPNQKVLSKFFKLRYLDAAEFQKLVKPLLTPSSSTSVLFPSSNALFITDTMANLQSIENLAKRTDMPIAMIEAVNFIPLNNVKASAVVKKFDQLKRGALKKYLTTTTIDCDDASNQLIIITPQENFATIANIAKQLDNKCELLLRSETLRIKHGDAKKISDIVSGIIKEQRSRIEKENKMAFERQQAQMTAQGSLANALAQAASGSRSNQQISNTYSDFITSQQVPGSLEEEQSAHFSANLTLAADERSNSIIIYGTASDLVQVRTLIANLDILLDQVRIEVIVAQVTLIDGQQSGLETLTLGHNLDDPGIKSKTTGRSHDINFSSTFGTEGGSGGVSKFKGTLKNFALENVFNKAKTNSNIKILSTPTLVTTHNRKAQFKIGEDRPFVDSSTKSDDSNSKERIQLSYKHVGLELTVTPLIGSNGIIQMELEQKVSKHSADVDISGMKAPMISDKQINSFVSVANEDVIVLAGFKERIDTKGGGKMFILGDIPILGDALFTSKARKEEIVELIIFIKPTIILHPQDEAAYLDKRLEITNFKEDISQYKATGDFPKGEPFPRDTILGLNGQEMSRQAKLRKQKEQQRKEELARAKANAKANDIRPEHHKRQKNVASTDSVSVTTSDESPQTETSARSRRRRHQQQKNAASTDSVSATTSDASAQAETSARSRRRRRQQQKNAASIDSASKTTSSTLAQAETSAHSRRRRRKKNNTDVRSDIISQSLATASSKKSAKHARRRR